MSGSTMSQTVFRFHLYIFWQVHPNPLGRQHTEWESSVAELHLSPPPSVYSVSSYYWK